MAKRKKTKSPFSKAARVTSEPSTTSAAEVTAFQSKFAPVSWTIVLQALFIILAGLWIYWPALHGDWLWDDTIYITQNTLLHNPARFWEIWFAPGTLIDYYPATFTVQWLQWRLWHTEPLGYHVTNLVLHLLSALLVWKLFRKLGLRLAWLGGLLFTIHPVQVESVAWISELKNTLSLPLLLLAMFFYLDYAKCRKNRDYFLALAFFGVALLSKISVVMFPVVILLYTWWKRKRIGWNNLKASVPFFLLSLAAGLIILLSGVWDQQFNHLGPDKVPSGGIFARLVLAGQEIAFYFSKSFLPMELLPVYPKWTVDVYSPLSYLPWLVLGEVIYCLWQKHQNWARTALFALGFFFINLLPCPGFIPAPNMGYAWVMDHFLYLPIIGLIGLFIAIMEQAKERLPLNARRIGMGIMIIILVLLVYKSHSYAKKFVNSKTLWIYTLRHNPQASPAYNNLGIIFRQSGQIAEAMKYYREALRINPNYTEADNNMGVALEHMGQTTEAMKYYREALRINPNYAEADNNMGVALEHMGQITKAMEYYREALRINFDTINPHYNLGVLLLKSNHLSEAIEQFNQALQLKPDYVEARINLGVALAQSGRIAEAIEQYEMAVRINPDNTLAKNNLEYLEALQKAAPVKK